VRWQKLLLLELLGFNLLCSQAGWCPQPGTPMAACRGFSSAPARKTWLKRTCNDVQTSGRCLVSNSRLIHRVAGLDGANTELEGQGCWGRELRTGRAATGRMPGRSPSNYGVRTDLLLPAPPHCPAILLSSCSSLTGTRQPSHNAMGGKHLLKRTILRRISLKAQFH